MRRAGFLRALIAAAALAIAPALAFALEEQSLLTPDGTLHVLRAGKAIDLGLAEAHPESIVIEHSIRAQDGTETVAILPGSESYQDKRGLQLGYDEETHTLLLLWTEDISAYSHIRVGVFHDGVWTNSALLPSQGISRAYNPEMRVTHQRVTYLDENDAIVAKTSSIVSVVWWEEAALLQARFAALFLDEAVFDPSNLAVYDLPALTGGVGASAYNDVPSGAYLYPDAPGRRPLGRRPRELRRPARPPPPRGADPLPGLPGQALGRREHGLEAPPHADRGHRVGRPPGRHDAEAPSASQAEGRRRHLDRRRLQAHHVLARRGHASSTRASAPPGGSPSGASRSTSP